MSVRINPKRTLVVSNFSLGRSIGLGNLVNVSEDGKVDGSLLIYSANTDKWEAGTLLDKQEINGGYY